jgi:hypothetical protein
MGLSGPCSPWRTLCLVGEVERTGSWPPTLTQSPTAGRGSSLQLRHWSHCGQSQGFGSGVHPLWFFHPPAGGPLSHIFGVIYEGTVILAHVPSKVQVLFWDMHADGHMSVTESSEARVTGMPPAGPHTVPERHPAW